MKETVCRWQSSDGSLLHFMDRYLKKVMINAKTEYYRINGKAKNYGITCCSLDTEMEDLFYEEPAYSGMTFYFGRSPNEKVFIENSLLIEALLCLNEQQRILLFQNIVLQYSLQDIADIYGISKQKIQRDKKKALIRMRKKMRTPYGETT